MMFYLLNILSGVLETGYMAWALSAGYDLWVLLLFPFAYQLGNLFPKPFSVGKIPLMILALAALSLSCALVVLNPSGMAAAGLVSFDVFALSVIMQSVRSTLKTDGNRAMKRITRILGFAVAPVCIFIPYPMLILFSLILLTRVFGYKGKFSVVRMKDQKLFGSVMIFHQLHYFFYVYPCLAAIALILSGRYQGASGIFCSYFLFAVTWVTYMSVEIVMKKVLKERMSDEALPVFYTGHSGIVILLLIMSLSDPADLWYIPLWIIMGFCGGTVFTIYIQADKDDARDEDSMTVCENVGHIVGIFGALVLAFLYGNISVNITLAMSSVSGLIAIILMTRTFLRSRHK